MNASKTIASAIAALSVAGFAYAQSTTDPAVTTPTPAQTVQPNSSYQATTPNSSSTGTMNSTDSSTNSTGSMSGSSTDSSTMGSERAPQSDRG